MDRKTVETIAHLARIRVPEEEIDGLVREVSQILEWVEQLAEVDTATVAPMTSVTDLTPPWREDRVADGGDQKQVLSNAPDRVDVFYAVPKVVE